jgi:predicted transposase YdaD
LFLMELRSEEAFARPLLEGVQNMRESTTYQAILREGRDEGRISEAQRLLLRQGEIRFGAPDQTTRGAVEAIHDLDRLERMSDRVLDMSIDDWAGLLSTP